MTDYEPNHLLGVIKFMATQRHWRPSHMLLLDIVAGEQQELFEQNKKEIWHKLCNDLVTRNLGFEWTLPHETLPRGTLMLTFEICYFAGTRFIFFSSGHSIPITREYVELRLAESVSHIKHKHQHLNFDWTTTHDIIATVPLDKLGQPPLAKFWLADNNKQDSSTETLRVGISGVNINASATSSQDKNDKIVE